MKGRKEGNVLFNDTLNTFYLWRRTYSKGSSPNGLLFPISSKGSFYIHHPTNRIVYTMGFITQVFDHWLEREKELNWSTMRDQSDDPPYHERMLYNGATSCYS